jgi:hypothetical protein
MTKKEHSDRFTRFPYFKIRPYVQILRACRDDIFKKILPEGIPFHSVPVTSLLLTIPVLILLERHLNISARHHQHHHHHQHQHHPLSLAHHIDLSSARSIYKVRQDASRVHISTGTIIILSGRVVCHCGFLACACRLDYILHSYWNSS